MNAFQVTTTSALAEAEAQVHHRWPNAVSAS